LDELKRDALQVLKQAVEEGNDSHGPKLILSVLGDLEGLLAETQSHFKSCDSWLAIRSWEADRLEVLRLLVHHVDDKREATVEVLVKDTTVFHDRLHDVLEEVPHALAGALLVVNELAKAGQALVRALCEHVVQRRQDGRLQDFLKLRVHLGVPARDRLNNAAESGHEALSGEARLLVQIELATVRVRLFRLKDAQVGL